VKPLEGCRVLDLGIITAGAATSAILADLGAEVIKVESPTYRDPFRVWAGAGTSGADMLPPHFRATNRNKRAISIDLKTLEGRAIMMRLVTKADVVVENFRRGVLANLGLAFDALRTANPRIVLASVSSQGETGPDAAHVSYGSTLEAVSGLAWGTGYPGGRPEVSGRDVNYPDQVVAIFAAGAIGTAIRSVRKGGEAVHLDISQRDLTAFLYGEAFVATSRGGTPQRVGNAEAPYLVQDCFRAADGIWVAVSVEEGDVPGLRARLCPAATIDPASLRACLEGAIAPHSAEVAVAMLATSGVKAAPVVDGRGVLAREGEAWSHALHRVDRSIVKGFPFQIDETPLSIERDVPEVGEHTVEVLTQVGGYSMAEVAAFAAAGIVEIRKP
jgi:crotonobetainyl-CoA:carnitine CoA-transferase CaiB-like acyl-CoA transferase